MRLNKFLEFSFKLGKILSSIMLVIVLIVMIGAGIVLVNFSCNSVQTPNFELIKTSLAPQITQQSGVQNHYIDADNNVQYNKYIDKIIKENNLRTEARSYIKKSLEDIPKDYKEQYLAGLNKFYKKGLVELKNDSNLLDNYLKRCIKRMNYYLFDNEYYYSKRELENGHEKISENLYIACGMVEDYYEMFKNAINEMEINRQNSIMQKISAACVLGVSLLIFVILLFLPILIKIEENTRPEKSIDIEPENTTKECPNCHKQIKINAKKCRFCGQWLEE